MHRLDYRHSYRSSNLWMRFRQRLVYLPGALVLAYGFWLSLNA